MKAPDWRFGFLMLLAALVSASAFSRDDNGFDLGGSLVPLDEIHLGGPSKDGISAIDRPKLVSAQQAGFLDGREGILGLVRGGEAKAYPFAELSRTRVHEIRDKLNGKELSIRFDRANESALALDASGEQLPAVTSYWLAWYGFHPQTEVFTVRPQ